MIDVVTFESIANKWKRFCNFYIIYVKDIYEAEEIIINKLKAEQSISYEIKAHFRNCFVWKKRCKLKTFDIITKETM